MRLLFKHRLEAVGHRLVDIHRFWRDERRRSRFQLIKAQIKIVIEFFNCRCIRLWLRFDLAIVAHHVLDKLRLQLGGHCRGGNACRSGHSHARIATFELLDLGMIFAIGYQLALLGDKGVTITHLAVDPHQLKAQITALRLLIDRHLE